MNISNFFSKKDNTDDEEVAESSQGKKIRKKEERKNITSLESPVKARVSSSLSDDDDDDDDAAEKSSGQCKGGHQEKIKFSGEMIKVCLSSEESSMEIYEKKLLSNLCLLAIYMDESSLEKAFYANSDKDSIYVFDGYNGNIIIEEIPLDGITAEEMAESYFEGEAHSKIDETLQAIKSTYTKESRMQEILLVAGALLVLAGGYYLLTDSNNVVTRTQPPKPTYELLSRLESFFIQRGLTNLLIEKVVEDIQEFEKDKTLSGVRRIIGYSMSAPMLKAPEEPTLVDEQYWQWQPGIARRGGYTYTLMKTEQQVYPGVGFTSSSEDLFTKSTQEDMTLDDNFLDKNYLGHSRIALTEECVVLALRTASGKTIPKMRDDMSIQINFEKVTPSILVKDVLPLVKMCPLLIDMVTMDDKGEFSFMVSLYKIGNDPIVGNGGNADEK